MVEKNRILAGMPLNSKKYWGIALESVELNAGDVLLGPNFGFDYVYFPIDCIVSLSTQTGDGFFASFALIGSEGVVGASVFLGDASNTYLAKVERGGKA